MQCYKEATKNAKDEAQIQQPIDGAGQMLLRLDNNNNNNRLLVACN
jgi:hypothetical protein